MRKIRKLTVQGYITLLCFLSSFAIAQAQNFELKDNDRVLFLGNSIFENENQFGYIEMALTTRWPDRNITFRNIGWTGDNVFGEARSYFTNPPTAYDLLMQQITDAKPTIVFIAYGGIEAQGGETAIPRFKEGLNKLIDKVNNLGARTVLLSPIPVLLKNQPERVTKQNDMILKYSSEIAKIASERGKLFVDIFKPLINNSSQYELSDNGIHLNQTGYYFLANAIENGLGLPERKSEISISVNKNTVEASFPVKLEANSKSFGSLSYNLKDKMLPLPLPESLKRPDNNKQLTKIAGLKKGVYALKAGKEIVAIGNSEDWAKGIEINEGLSFQKASQLQGLIFKKNDIFFQQYRPLNRTYIVGFRKYEQGRHQEGLNNMNILITWLEAQIASQRVPEIQDYQLFQVK